jgi:hypothetical protein
MDSAQLFLFDLGWFFFAAWGMVIAAVSFVAFKADLAEIVSRPNASENRSAL